MRHPAQSPAPQVTTVAEYDGGLALRVAATQLDARYSATAARRIVDEWCEFFAAGPSRLVDLSFVSRTPRRLFMSLAGQTQLTALRVKWGDYDDLSPLEGMQGLTELWLGGASSVRNLEPLASLAQLRELTIESLRFVSDLSPLGALPGLRFLDVGGDWASPRNVHVDSIAFLRNLPGLEQLGLFSIIVDDLDYSPLLALPALKSARVKKVRGMRPAHEQLCAAVPALEPAP